MAEDVGDLGAVGIDALVLGQEADPGNSKAMDLLALLRRDLPLEPNEAALGCKPRAQLGGINVRHDGGEQFGSLIDVDDAVRFGEQRRRAHVGRQNFAVPVKDVRPRRRDRILCDDAPQSVALGCHGEHNQSRCDNRVAQCKDEYGERDPRARLGGAIDPAAVEQ